MAEIKHTPEPWAADGTDICQQEPYNLHIIATMAEWRSIDEEKFRIHQSTEYGTNYLVNLEVPGSGGGEEEANARRIVACVNACKGIPTEALEAGVLKGVLEVLADILELADTGLTTIEFEVNEKVQGTMFNRDDVLDAKEVITRAETALSKVKGE